MALAGMFTADPCSPLPDPSVTRTEEMSRLKSQAATRPSSTLAETSWADSALSYRRGLSILPLKWPSTTFLPDSSRSANPAIVTGVSLEPRADKDVSCWTLARESSVAHILSGSWLSVTLPVAASKVAARTYHCALTSGTPVLTLSTLPDPSPNHRAGQPSSPMKRPYPVLSDHLVRIPWRPFFGVVGHMYAKRVKLPLIRKTGESGTVTYEPLGKTCLRPGWLPLIGEETTSSLTPGPSGLGSPWTTLTKSARYSGSSQLTMTRTDWPGSTLIGSL